MSMFSAMKIAVTVASAASLALHSCHFLQFHAFAPSSADKILDEN